MGNSIYLIQNGVLLVPYSILNNAFSLSQEVDSVKYHCAGSVPTQSYTPGIRLDKNVIIDEPYELHFDGYTTATPNYAAIGYSNEVLISNSPTYDDISIVIQSGSGQVTLGKGANSSTTATYDVYIKNLYFKRIREE